MTRVHLLVLLCLLAVACRGDSRSGSSSSSGAAIDGNGNLIDGATHSAFEADGEGLETDGVLRGSGDVTANQELPSGPDASTPDGEVAGQTDGPGPEDQSSCTPECAGKVCGDDGCGGLCGDCPTNFPFCLDGLCSNCEPDCAGISCGGDGCGGSCGSCPAGESCVAGACLCEPSCTEATCGEDDGCGQPCPPCDAIDATDASSDGSASDVPGDGVNGQTDTSVGPEDAASTDANGEDSSGAVDSGPSADTSSDIGSEDGGAVGPDAPNGDDVVSGDGGPSDGESDTPGGDSGGGTDAAGDAGSDLAANDSTPPEEDSGPPIPGPTAGELVITEVMRAPLDGANPGRQWFEIVSVVGSERTLEGCTFTDGLETGLVVPAGQSLLPYQRLVFAQDGGDEDGLLGADILYPTIANGGPDLSQIGVLTFACSSGVIDAIDLAAVAEDTSFPDEAGHAMQLDVGSTNATANDSPGAWCSSFKLYGAAGYGSPGVGNHPCDSEVDWCRIWSPGFKLAKVGELWEVITHLHEEGLTTLTSNAPDSSPTLKAQVGYGIDKSLPAEVPDQWTWFTGVAVEDPPAAVPPSDDRYVAVVTMTSTGIYDVAGRFSLDDGFTWTYCDLDGSANGYSASSTGHATIIP